MATTTHLGITLVDQSQSQKEVTINQAFAQIDSILNTGAKSKSISTPPGSPANGDVYIVAASPTGAWAGQANNIAYYNAGWYFIIPNEGMSLWVNDEDLTYSYNGSVWQAFVSQGIDVRRYGAIPDARKVSDMVTTSGSATATSATAVFTSADVGKKIKIYDVANNVYVFQGAISSVTNSTTIVLSATASATTISGNAIAYWGTDNASAIQSAFNAAAALIAGDYTSANFPAGRGQIRVLFPIDTRGDAYLFNTTLTMARNVGIDAQAMLFSNAGNGASDRNWAINGSSGAFITNLVMEVGGGMGVHIGTNSTTNSSSVIGNLQIWNAGFNFNGSLGIPSQIGLQLTGNDFSINRFWCKGGCIGLHLNQVLDVFCNQAILVSAATGVQLVSAENVNIARMVCDTCSFVGLVIDGSHNCTINGNAFSTNSTALTYGIEIGANDTVDINRNLNINFAAECTGGTVLSLAYSQDSIFNINATNSALYSANGLTISNCVQYGSGNTGNLYVFVNRDANISALSSGTITGTLIGNTAGDISINGALDTFRNSYNGQSGTSYTLSASDSGKVLRFTSSSAVTLTLPNSLPVGFNCKVIQAGTAQVTFSPASGATRVNRSSNTKTAGQWAMCDLRVDNNSGGTSAEYVLSGDTA